MTGVLASLIIGILIGTKLRNRTRIVRASERSTDVAVCILLLFLGAAVGSNRAVISNLGSLGWQAFVLGSAAMIGSVAVTYLVERYFFKTAGPNK